MTLMIQTALFTFITLIAFNHPSNPIHSKHINHPSNPNHPNDFANRLWQARELDIYTAVSTERPRRKTNADGLMMRSLKLYLACLSIVRNA